MDSVFKRDGLGRLVRELWIGWAKTQSAPKPSWLVPYDELSEIDKEADRVIGEGLYREFCAANCGQRLRIKTLEQIGEQLRDVLNGFRILYDEHDPESKKAIEAFDRFTSPAGLSSKPYKVMTPEEYAQSYKSLGEHTAITRVVVDGCREVCIYR